MRVEEENLYKDPYTNCPINRTTNEISNSLSSFTSQYKKNKALHKIKNGTLKLKTDMTAKALGGKKGKV
ncbi:hypothetical protein ACFQ0I_06500 [Mariniflexile aquimaris]|uniref:Uncharacterized protein n=1 Tax=Mariniflexile aquimaris TaxID=881009 RepID=A0ABW3BRR9_9FLAO